MEIIYSMAMKPTILEVERINIVFCQFGFRRCKQRNLNAAISDFQIVQCFSV